MPNAPASDIESAKRLYSNLVRAVLDLAADCPESRHVVALAIIVDAFHDDILRPLECGRRAGRPTLVETDQVAGDRKLH
ncbi:MAG: hypothetical protein EPO51_04190 [Phenylobacterium sp.]|uniref:hypothetical protein n=1 Tax=Phenylobacterium sp. TaxID=1871053 RepID=UPI00121ED823|nr:hypothetical protein [Phenylobacterium sp.]TAJ73683.1 MAG: hypothetical protein EPO51_04190 [Phenylobacterium sp.]